MLFNVKQESKLKIVSRKIREFVPKITCDRTRSEAINI